MLLLFWYEDEDKWLKLVKLVVNCSLLNRIPNSPTAPQSSHLVSTVLHQTEQICTRVCKFVHQSPQLCKFLHESAHFWHESVQFHRKLHFFLPPVPCRSSLLICHWQIIFTTPPPPSSLHSSLLCVLNL